MSPAPRTSREVRAQLKAVVALVLGEREDKHIVGPILLSMLHGALSDFAVCFEARHARNRVKDTEILHAWRKAKRAKEQP